MKKIAIFIPTYNAANTLPIVLDRIPESIKRSAVEIFVIDNASADNTYFVGVGYKHEKNLMNLQLIKNDKNRGYGGSQKIAYKYAIEKRFDIIVMLHGDAQYAPEYIPNILVPLESGEADLVFGSRMTGDPLKGGMPLWRYIGNKVLTKIENAVLNLGLSEFHSGFRAFTIDSLKQVPFELCADDYHFDTDILIQFKIKNLRIREQPIPTHYGRESHSPSVFQTMNYSINILRSMLEYVFHIKGLRYEQKFKIK